MRVYIKKSSPRRQDFNKNKNMCALFMILGVILLCSLHKLDKYGCHCNPTFCHANDMQMICKGYAKKGYTNDMQKITAKIKCNIKPL